ncbi:hypothetical protein M8J77_006666 [Diaphorina citri]|nr:hypothetical protein M8J77_006666 [Diaphorina citri]
MPNSLPTFLLIATENSLSNSSQVVLRDIGLNLSGLMRCEVTADAPTYKTSLANKTMTVVDSLPGKIKFWSEQSFYKAGDMLIASCTSPPSRPPSVLTFLINNKTALPLSTRSGVPQGSNLGPFLS